MSARESHNDLVEHLLRYHEAEPMWGSLHIVLEDYNTELDHIGWCIKWAMEHGDVVGADLGIALLAEVERRGSLLPLFQSIENAERTLG